MATYGRYETIRMIGTSAFGEVSSAQLAESSRPCVVKTYQPPPYLFSEEELQRGVSAFLERASIQRQVAASGSSHWAPIHEMAAIPGGAYVVSNQYETTGQKLLDGRVNLSVGILHNLINSILRGLSEIKQACGRPHGNLKPSNILIENERDGRLTVALTDPSPAAELKSDSEARDLFNLGQFIRSLVTNQPIGSTTFWPIMMSDEWSRLGRKGEAWLILCNKLLHPQPQAGFCSVEDMQKHMPLLAASTVRATPRRVAITACIILSLGTGALAWPRIRQGYVAVTAQLKHVLAPYLHDPVPQGMVQTSPPRNAAALQLLSSAKEAASLIEKFDAKASALLDIAEAMVDAGDAAEAKRVLSDAGQVVAQIQKINDYDSLTKGKLLIDLGKAQAKAGELREASETVSNLDRYDKDPVICAIAEAQAKEGDIAVAQQTVSEIGEYYEPKAWALIAIAKAQIKAHNIAGAVKSLAEAREKWHSSGGGGSSIVAIAKMQNSVGDLAGEKETERQMETMEALLIKVLKGEQESLKNKAEELRKLIVNRASQDPQYLARYDSSREVIGLVDEFENVLNRVELYFISLGALAEARVRIGDAAGAKETFAKAKQAAVEFDAQTTYYYGDEFLAPHSRPLGLEPSVAFNKLGFPSALLVVAEAQARVGDVHEAMQTASGAGFDHKNKAQTYRAIAEAQTKAGDVMGAKQTASTIGGAEKAYALCAIAAEQATTGDAVGAQQTLTEAEATGSKIDIDKFPPDADASQKLSVLRAISEVEARTGDVGGIQHRAAAEERADLRCQILIGAAIGLLPDRPEDR